MVSAVSLQSGCNVDYTICRNCFDLWQEKVTYFCVLHVSLMGLLYKVSATGLACSHILFFLRGF